MMLATFTRLFQARARQKVSISVLPVRTSFRPLTLFLAAVWLAAFAIADLWWTSSPVEHVAVDLALGTAASVLVSYLTLQIDRRRTCALKLRHDLANSLAALQMATSLSVCPECAKAQAPLVGISREIKTLQRQLQVLDTMHRHPSRTYARHKMGGAHKAANEKSPSI